MKRCPECGEPPHYTSFCTTCAALFRRPRRKWDSYLRALEDKVIRRVAKRIAREARDAEFRRIYHECESHEQLAARLGKRLSTIKLQRWELGLPPYPRSGVRRSDRWWTKEQDAELAEAITRGVSAREAAARVGRSIGSVRYRAGAVGMGRFKVPTAEHRVWSRARIDKLAQLRRAGLTYKEIARQLGTKRNAIAGAIHLHLRPAEVTA